MKKMEEMREKPVGTYWDGNGKHQGLADALQTLIPFQGEIKGRQNRMLDKFRKASNAYYDIFNNGGFNRGRSIRAIFGLSLIEFRDRKGHIHNWDAIHRIVEPVMDQIVLNAAAEQVKKKA